MPHKRPTRFSRKTGASAKILLEIRTIQTLLEIRIAVHRPSVRHQADLDKREKATRGVWPAASSDVGVVAITNRDVIIVFFPRLQARLFQQCQLNSAPKDSADGGLLYEAWTNFF